MVHLALDQDLDALVRHEQRRPRLVQPVLMGLGMCLPRRELPGGTPRCLPSLLSRGGYVVVSDGREGRTAGATWSSCGQCLLGSWASRGPPRGSQPFRSRTHGCCSRPCRVQGPLMSGLFVHGRRGHVQSVQQYKTRPDVRYHMESTSSLQAGGEQLRQGLDVPLPMRYGHNADMRARTRQAPGLGAMGNEVRPFSKFSSFFQRTRTSYTGNLGRAGCEHCWAGSSLLAKPLFSSLLYDCALGTAKRLCCLGIRSTILHQLV